MKIACKLQTYLLCLRYAKYVKSTMHIKNSNRKIPQRMAFSFPVSTPFRCISTDTMSYCLHLRLDSCCFAFFFNYWIVCDTGNNADGFAQLIEQRTPVRKIAGSNVRTNTMGL